jgi:purine-cytosine permease-like protein
VHEEHFRLWAKYEEVAMHFNELIMRWRLQAIGGLAGIVTLAGFVVADAPDFETRYRAMLILIVMIGFAWIAVAFVDLFYYRRLLAGAVGAITDLEKQIGSISLSTRIEQRAKKGATWTAVAFYVLGFVPLAGIALWAIYQLRNPPPLPAPLLL